jgi:hypothetical protein
MSFIGSVLLSFTLYMCKCDLLTAALIDAAELSPLPGMDVEVFMLCESTESKLM